MYSRDGNQVFFLTELLSKIDLDEEDSGENDILMTEDTATEEEAHAPNIEALAEQIQQLTDEQQQKLLKLLSKK